MTADSPDLDRLDALARAATEGPWTRGDRWHVAGVTPKMFGEGKCAYCHSHGEPTWVGKRDINGTKMLAHVHADSEPWHDRSIYAEREDGPVTVIVETDEYGDMTDEDAAYVTAFDPPTVLALISELRQARAQLAAVQRIVDHPPFCGEVHVDTIRHALALHGVPHEWVQTTRLGSRNLEYVCAHCDQTKTEPRPDCTTDQEDTSP